MSKQKQSKNIGPEGYLEITKQHKDWYHAETMGKQRGKPRYDLKENKKQKSGRNK